MVNKKQRNNIIIILCCIILVQFFLCIHLISSPIEVEIEKEVVKEVIVEVEKEVIVEIEKEVPVEVIVEVEPTYAYNISSEEREMLARLIFREANTESLECQKAIVSVVINRWQNGYWGNTLANVVYSSGQFTPASTLWKTTPTERNYQAVDAVLKDGCTVPSYVMYFRANYGFSKTWKGYEEYKRIDDVYFGFFIRDKQ